MIINSLNKSIIIITNLIINFLFNILFVLWLYLNFVKVILWCFVKDFDKDLLNTSINYGLMHIRLQRQCIQH